MITKIWFRGALAPPPPPLLIVKRKGLVPIGLSTKDKSCTVHRWIELSTLTTFCTKCSFCSKLTVPHQFKFRYIHCQFHRIFIHKMFLAPMLPPPGVPWKSLPVFYDILLKHEHHTIILNCMFMDAGFKYWQILLNVLSLLFPQYKIIAFRAVVLPTGRFPFQKELRII